MTIWFMLCQAFYLYAHKKMPVVSLKRILISVALRSDVNAVYGIGMKMMK